jgi:peptide/nickel transport system permease protein
LSNSPPHGSKGIGTLITYIIRRIFWSAVTLIGVIVVVFFILHLSGDPAVLLLPIEATAADVERLRNIMGFDRPLYVQFWDFFQDALRGDFGNSFRYRSGAMLVVLERVPATVTLAASALAVALVISLPIGILAAVRKNSSWDSFAMGLALVGQAVPGFFLAIVMIYVFAVKLQVLPSYGFDGWRSLLLPSITLGVYSAASLTRMLRGNLSEVLQQDYIRTAKSKGISFGGTILRHGLRNAVLPIVTLLGVQVGVLLGGSVITETVFAWPGMGRLVVQAVLNRDYPVVQAAVFFTAVVFLAVSLVIDILYTVLDPRIRY